MSLEEKLDEKTAELIHLQRVTLEQADASPVKNAQVVSALGGWGNSTTTNGSTAAAAAAAAETGSSGGRVAASTSEGPSSSSHADHNGRIAAMAKEIEKLRADKVKCSSKQC